VQIKVKTQNGKKLQLPALVDSECIYTGTNKQLVKNENIKTKPVNIASEVFNVDGTKNGEVIQFVLLEIKINRHKEQIDTVVTDLNGINIFLGYDWLERGQSI